jgi:hypothetical protein
MDSDQEKNPNIRAEINFRPAIRSERYREVRSIVKYLPRMDKELLGLVIHIASKMARVSSRSI